MEADRGHDLGRVVRVEKSMDALRHSLSQAYGESNGDKKISMPMKELLRLASDQELRTLFEKVFISSALTTNVTKYHF